VSDDWQSALFSGPLEQSCTPEMFFNILRNLCLYKSGILDAEEQAYYDRLAKLCGDYLKQRKAGAHPPNGP